MMRTGDYEEEYFDNYQEPSLNKVKAALIQLHCMISRLDYDSFYDADGDDLDGYYETYGWMILFFLLHWYPPKKYGKPRLGESTLT